MDQPLNEPTYIRIKRAIIADLVGRAFRPGDHLTIDMLVGRYRVSHMPIREALRQLEGEGLLVSLAHRGFRLKPLSEDYIRNIYDVRVGIESMLARRAAERATAAEISDLRALHERFVADMQVSDGLVGSRTNTDFHARLYAIAGNPEAEEILSGRTRIVRSVGDSFGGYAPAMRDAVISEHERIIEALAAGDAEACGQAVFDHVTAARDRLIARLRAADHAMFAEDVVG
jgi:DNA-binding GntR family transcriptional regulator